MNKYKALIVLAFPLTLGLIINSCTKDMGVAPKPVVAVPGFCDTITYTEDIKPIIDVQCVDCHTKLSTSGYPLDSYELLVAKAKEGKIQLRVIDQKNMPQAGPLPQNELDLISCWLNNGYKK